MIMMIRRKENEKKPANRKSSTMVQIPILANKYLKIIVMDTLKHVQKKMNLMKERISHVNRNDLIRFTHTFSPSLGREEIF